MRLKRQYFKGDPVTLAKDLLGKVLVYRSEEGVFKGIITETEAYHEDDPAAHCFKGRRTPRNEIMFAKGGYFYVYFTYGMHYCANIVVDRKGTGAAVLIRAIEPLQQEKLMRKNRKFTRKGRKGLVDGPAKLCMAYGIDTSHNWLDLCIPGSSVYLADYGHRPTGITTSTRIGISRGTTLEWRFLATGISASEKK